MTSIGAGDGIGIGAGDGGNGIVEGEYGSACMGAGVGICARAPSVTNTDTANNAIRIRKVDICYPPAFIKGTRHDAALAGEVSTIDRTGRPLFLGRVVQPYRSLIPSAWWTASPNALF